MGSNQLKYSIWTIGCQMNKAESREIADYIQSAGYEFISSFKKADLVLLNTCVVRQNAEDKAMGMLGYLKGLKKSNHDLKVIVTGCFVDSNIIKLQNDFPFVDLFFKPGDFGTLLGWLQQHKQLDYLHDYSSIKNGDIISSVMIPIIQGCNNFCTYCIVPYRRGREKSRQINDIIQEVTNNVDKGAKEVILIGQNVNSYGHDLSDGSDLSMLLNSLNRIENLFRIRFLTNHPKDMNIKLIETIASLDKVCKHINIPVQAGDNVILEKMGRDYTTDHYVNLLQNMREIIPSLALSTDIIVGFPGETDTQFKSSLNIVKTIRFDTVHVAAYSPRSGTIAAKNFNDDIPVDVKMERLHRIEELQTEISSEINNKLLDKKVLILVEGKKKNRWFGRTESDKLVFFESENNCLNKMINVFITKSSPWALQGNMVA